MKRPVGIAVVALALALAAGALAYVLTRPSEGRLVAAEIKMVALPGGDFVMGVAADEEHEQQAYPARVVHMRPFRIASTDVTFAQYDRFAAATKRALPQDEGFGRGSRPVINVDRQEALAFVAWLNAEAGRQFRLPSEAEWEYAARGGTTTAYFWGEQPSVDYANLTGDVGRDRFIATAPVASFRPNGFGLYDMVGNIWRMTEDCRHSTLEGAPTDGSAWLGTPCDSRIARGGWFGSGKRGSKVTTRTAVHDGYRSMALGFRLVEASAGE